MVVQTAPKVATPHAYQAFMASFARHLRAENKSEKTQRTYLQGVEQLGAFLAAQGMPTQVLHIKREHVESFVADLLERWKPYTALNRYRSIALFFKWLGEEGEIRESPMARMKPPAVPESPPAVLGDDDLRALLKVCEGRGFAERRDMAIVRLLLDTGLRRAEIAGLRVEDIDWDHETVIVMGKGRRPRACPFGRKTSQALDRYLRVRARREDAALPELWLGKRGPMTDSGVHQIVQSRAEQAGIGHITTHQFRHTFAHRWQDNEGNETDLMRIMGWRSRDMLNRYAASAGAERARRSHKRMGPGDSL